MVGRHCKNLWSRLVVAALLSTSSPHFVAEATTCSSDADCSGDEDTCAIGDPDTSQSQCVDVSSLTPSIRLVKLL